MDIHEAIHALAREGISVRAIAERIQCSASHVRNLLAGKGEYIPVRSVALICQALAEIEAAKATKAATPVADALGQAEGTNCAAELVAADVVFGTSGSGLGLRINPDGYVVGAGDSPPAQSARPIGWWSRLLRRLSGARLQRELER